MATVTVGARPTLDLPALSSGRMKLSMGTCWVGASPNLSRSSWPKHMPSPENAAQEPKPQCPEHRGGWGRGPKWAF